MKEKAKDIIAQGDPIPGADDPLAPVADLEQVRQYLATSILACQSGIDLVDIRRDDIRYVPGTEASVLYKLWFRRKSGKVASQSAVLYLPVYGKLPAPPTPHQIASYKKVCSKVLHPHTISVPELGAVLHPLPIDLRLSRLVDALDRAGMKEQLNLVCDFGDRRVSRVKPRLISHTLGSRATIRYNLILRDAEGVKTTDTVIGKINAARPLAPLLAANHALYRQTCREIGQARPLGMIQSLGLSLQSFAGETRLTDVLDQDKAREWLTDVGRQLACLHNTRIPTDTKRDSGRELRSLQRRCALLADVLPDGDRVLKLSKKLRSEIEARMRITSLVHGDFHHANIMVDTHGVRIVDFDEMGLGDPHLDTARFMVSLSMPSLRYFGDLRLCDLARESYLPAYRAVRDTNSASLYVFEALAWIASAATAFRLHRPGWQDHVDQMIERAERALASIIQSAVPSELCLPTAVSDDSIRSWLEDTDYLTLRLKPGVEDLFGVELTELQLSKKKQAGRRQKLTYRAKGFTQDSVWRGKLHALAGRGVGPAALAKSLNHIIELKKTNVDLLDVPRPLAHVPSLLMLVYEGLAGQSANSALRHKTNVWQASELGRAIAAFQSTDAEQISLSQTNTYEDLLHNLRKQAQKNCLDLSDFDKSADKLTRTARLCPSPGVRKLSQVVLTETGPATEVPELMAMEPPEAVPAFLLREMQGVPTWVRAFRNGYLERSGCSAESLAQWTKLIGLVERPGA